MIRTSQYKSILHLLILVSFSLYPFKGVAEIVTALGQSYITSSIDIEVYRQRAIDNALQNIINDKNLHLNSFSIVENGQVLFDQIQSSSKAGILSYAVIDEFIKDKFYYVNLEAIIDEDSNSTEKEICRNTKLSEIDFNIGLSVNSVKFPAWILLNDNWLKNEIKKQVFSHNLIFTQEKIHASNPHDSYSLFEQKENASNHRSPYELSIKTTLNFSKQNYFLLSNEELELYTHATIFRFGKPISVNQTKKKFRIGQKFGANFAINSRRDLWNRSKKDLLDAIHLEVQSRLDELKCIVIEPELIMQGSTNYITFGEKDGIKSNDIFVIADNNPKKMYFKIVKISDHRTELELISKSQKNSSLIGQTLKLIEGL